MLTVSVGRNVGTVPMSGDDWTTLIDRCRDALNVTVGIPDTVHYGTGVWDGIPEESAILTVFSPDLAHYAQACRTLAAIADAYGQDAIAVTQGTTDLVRPLDYATPSATEYAGV